MHIFHSWLISFKRSKHRFNGFLWNFCHKPNIRFTWSYALQMLMGQVEAILWFIYAQHPLNRLIDVHKLFVLHNRSFLYFIFWNSQISAASSWDSNELHFCFFTLRSFFRIHIFFIKIFSQLRLYSCVKYIEGIFRIFSLTRDSCIKTTINSESMSQIIQLITRHL